MHTMKKSTFILAMASTMLLASCGHRVLTSDEVASYLSSSEQPPVTSSSSEQPPVVSSSSEEQPPVVSSSSEEQPPVVSSSSSEQSQQSSEQSQQSQESSEQSQESSEVPSVAYAGTIGDAILVFEDISDSDKGEDTWVEQYKATNIGATAGDAIVITFNGEPIAPGASGKGNNAKLTEDGLEVVSTCEGETLYLKLYGDGGYDIWLTGYVAPEPSDTGYALTIGETEYDLADASDLPKGEDTWVEQYKASGINASAGDTIAITLDGEPISSGASGKGNNAKAGLSGLEVVSDCTGADLYLKLYGDGGYDLWLTGYSGSGEESSLDVVYFTNNLGWSTVNIYAFGGSGTSMTWPGTAMTFSHNNEYSQAVYTYSGLSDYESIIINDGSNQTIDIALSSFEDGNNGLYLLETKDGSGHYQVGFWKYTPAA